MINKQEKPELGAQREREMIFFLKKYGVRKRDKKLLWLWDQQGKKYKQRGFRVELQREKE